MVLLPNYIWNHESSSQMKADNIMIAFINIELNRFFFIIYVEK